MVLGWALNGSKNLPAPRIPYLDLAEMTNDQIRAVVDWVFSEFQAFGAEDQTAKQSAFTTRLKDNWSIAKQLYR